MIEQISSHLVLRFRPHLCVRVGSAQPWFSVWQRSHWKLCWWKCPEFWPLRFRENLFMESCSPEVCYKATKEAVVDRKSWRAVWDCQSPCSAEFKHWKRKKSCRSLPSEHTGIWKENFIPPAMSFVCLALIKFPSQMTKSKHLRNLVLFTQSKE